MTRPERSAEMFRGVEKNYWEYYRELEDDFLATRKYVSFHEANASTFSLEYLKLFQAVCSEIDVVGKAMAAACNQEFKPESSANNIYKWWYEIQEMYRCYEDAKSAVTGRCLLRRFCYTVPRSTATAFHGRLPRSNAGCSDCEGRASAPLGQYGRLCS